MLPETQSETLGYHVNVLHTLGPPLSEKSLLQPAKQEKTLQPLPRHGKFCPMPTCLAQPPTKYLPTPASTKAQKKPRARQRHPTSTKDHEEKAINN
ncbi:uncharacterized protein CCOS01_02997 [Colletotrichum costaricense]|uniref:Uncharacterized protein n=1 Tax=Colletotrichum costaricense TaxID=1209916 RepID=A0AAJ0E3Q1_9PEZI|nr:uncharacterized protein CCOS01_02997 [Colletotrichum costaricense]KAK1534245.1 hypothetical protein CCOS01_02997 [Colletotrichum costaricense]